ncbi:5-azacytidine-induced protein 1, partial [Operophtera brumata]
MSKENNNLRLLGSPVNLSYRNKKKDDRKNIRNRPRSALQTSYTKERAPTTRNLLKAFSAELLHSYNNSPSITTVKVVAPTADLLGDRKSPENLTRRRDISSNASDYGSEDTFISLGSKIKAKAQSSSKPKNTNTKNYLKYRNIAKKGRKSMENTISEDVLTANEYGMEVKITERQRSPTRPPSPARNKNMFNERSFSPTLKTRPYDSYFIPLDGERKETEDSLLGRVSFGNIHSEVEQAIDKYSRRLTLTKQQLSLVEEESTQDIDSVPSQKSLSPENSLEVKKDENVNVLDRNTYVAEIQDDYPKASHNFICDPRTYTSFYDDFRSNPVEPFKTKMSSTIIHTDASSKDSGYTDSGPNDDRYKQNYSLPSTSIMKRSSSYNNIDDQPKSLDSASTSSNGQGYHKTFPLDIKDQWAEPLNHSRLLYKDFFLKKEGHIALPPNNSPTKAPIDTCVGTSECTGDKETELEYPPYLANSTTKAYTSKVIEDYKKELEAINSLHQLTLKDIQTDSVSPTPLNIDKMFEEPDNFENKRDSETSPESISPEQSNNKTSFEMKQRREISKISTKELIQNYLKVKEGDAKDLVTKNLQKFDKKVNNVAAKFENTPSRYKQDWNNKKKTGIAKSNSNTQINIRNQTQKNIYTMHAPLSARIDGVHNDKDIDSWISISAPSPRIIDVDQVSAIEEPTQTEPQQTEPNVTEAKVESSRQLVTPRVSAEKETVKPMELNPNSSVLDIYSILKEIESYGDNPVASVTNVNVPDKETELAQRLVTATLQLEERSCCIALLQESLTNHKEQLVDERRSLEERWKRSAQALEERYKLELRNQHDKMAAAQQLVDERRSLEERWKRSAQALEERYKLELRNQHDKMAAAQQELTVKGLEGELREMAERQQKEVSDLKLLQAEQLGRSQARHAQELDELRRCLQDEKEAALVKERQMASARLEKQILELELTYQEQRTRLVAEMRAENER